MDETVKHFDRIDILVNNASYQVRSEAEMRQGLSCRRVCSASPPARGGDCLGSAGRGLAVSWRWAVVVLSLLVHVRYTPAVPRRACECVQRCIADRACTERCGSGR